MRTLVSDMAGRASIELRARELGLDLSGQGEVQSRIVALVKDLELRGWTFDAADASFELLLRREVTGEPISYCDVESWRVIAEARGDGGAVSALAGVYPEIDGVELVDYKVRILDSAHGSDAVTRVLIEMADDNQSWTTVGVAANIVEASWMALLDGLTYGLHSAGIPVR